MHIESLSSLGETAKNMTQCIKEGSSLKYVQKFQLYILVWQHRLGLNLLRFIALFATNECKNMH